MDDGDVDEECTGEGGAHGFEKLVFFEGGHAKGYSADDDDDGDEEGDEGAFEDCEDGTFLHCG